jgi:hypothetical protein
LQIVDTSDINCTGGLFAKPTPTAPRVAVSGDKRHCR